MKQEPYIPPTPHPLKKAAVYLAKDGTITAITINGRPATEAQLNALSANVIIEYHVGKSPEDIAPDSDGPDRKP